MITTFVFSADADAKVHLDFYTTPGNYIKSVDNYLSWCIFYHNLFSFYAHALHKEYCMFNEALKHTGADLQYEDINEGNNLMNLVGKCTLSAVITFANHFSQSNLSRIFHIGSTYMAFGALFLTLTHSLSHQTLARILQLKH